MLAPSSKWWPLANKLACKLGRSCYQQDNEKTFLQIGWTHWIGPWVLLISDHVVSTSQTWVARQAKGEKHFDIKATSAFRLTRWFCEKWPKMLPNPYSVKI
jgi:hypothetical protein